MIGGVEELGSSGRCVFVGVSAEFDVPRGFLGSGEGAVRVKDEKSIDCGIVSPAEMTPRSQPGTMQKVVANFCETAAINVPEDGATGKYVGAGVTLHNCYPYIPNAFDPLLFLRR